jgi:membrane peptidoglycan carboxypeptidase
MSLRTRLDGNDEKEFPGTPRPIVNFGGSSWGRVDLVEATRRSINTAYYQLGLEVGPAAVAETAHAAGIPDDTPLASPDGTVEGGISLGSYEVQVMDQAVGYATFANLGVPVRPFFVREVRRGDEMLFQTEVEAAPAAFSAEVAADATWAMQEVVQRGPSGAAQLDGGREAAGKTGTSSDNKDAWFVGFTPQLSTAVWLGYADPRTITVDGVEVTGGGLSSRIWKGFTDAALAGQPELDLPEPVYAGTRARFDDDVEQVSPPRSRRPRAPRAPAEETTTAADPTQAPVPTEPAEQAPVEQPTEEEPDEPEPAPAVEPSAAASGSG